MNDERRANVPVLIAMAAAVVGALALFFVDHAPTAELIEPQCTASLRIPNAAERKAGVTVTPTAVRLKRRG